MMIDSVLGIPFVAWVTIWFAAGFALTWLAFRSEAQRGKEIAIVEASATSQTDVMRASKRVMTGRAIVESVLLGLIFASLSVVVAELLTDARAVASLMDDTYVESVEVIENPDVTKAGGIVKVSGTDGEQRSIESKWIDEVGIEPGETPTLYIYTYTADTSDDASPTANRYVLAIPDGSVLDDDGIHVAGTDRLRASECEILEYGEGDNVGDLLSRTSTTR